MDMALKNQTNNSNGTHVRPMSLRAFLTRLIWLCMLPSLILTIYLAIDHVQTLKMQCHQAAISLAHNTANMIDNYLRSQIISLEVLAASPLLDDSKRLPDAFKEARSVGESLGVHIILADTSMQMVFNTRTPFDAALPKLPIPKGFAAAPNVMKTQKPAVGDVFYGPIAKADMVASVVPVIRNGQIKFLFLIATELSQFQRLMDEVALPEHLSVKILDGTGKVIAGRIPYSFQYEIAKADGQFIEKSHISPWTVVVDVPQCAYMPPIISSTITMTFAVIAAILGGVLGGRMAGKGLSRAVEGLSAKPLPLTSRPLISDIETVRKRLTDAMVAREAAEALKQEVELRFQRLFDVAPLPMCFVKRDGSLGELNERFVKVLGYTREDIPTFREWLILAYPSPDYRDKVLAAWDESIRQALAYGRDILPAEYVVTCKNGEERIMLISGAIMGDGYLATFFDITERKKAEKALVESEARFRILAEGAFEEVVVSRDGIFLDFNEVFSSICGYTAQELVGSRVLEIVAPEFRDLVQEHIMSGNVEAYESVLIHKDGRVIPVQIKAKNIPYMGGVARLTSVRSVESIKKAEEVQKRLATAITQAAEAILITDAEGIIQYVNPALERISGFSSAETLGHTPRIFKSGEHDDIFYQKLWATIKAGNIWSGRLINRRKDGKLYYEQATISPVIDDSGKIVNFVAVKRDITEFLDVTNQLFQSQKMEAIGTLAGGIAHDFNNILQISLGYSQLLAADKNLPPNLREDAMNIYEASKRGADLVHRLLTFSKKTVAQLKPLKLNDRINEIRKMLVRTIPKNIDMQLMLAEDLATINADPIQIDQVIMNVVVNARDAMPDGGVLTIETSNVTLDEEYLKTHLNIKPGRYVLLALTDTGIGMDEQTMSRIFEPFYTTKEHGHGTGLGLSVVFGIIRQHGGFIRYYSQPGFGTTCKIYFPALTSDETQVEPVAEKKPRGGSETILIVDDEEQIIDFLNRALEKAGYTVINARNGQEALDLYCRNRERISLVILDLIMPEMDGKKCLEELLKVDKSVKVLIASGFSANGRIGEVVRTGARGFVTKPFDVGQILNMIRDVIDGRP